MIRRCKSEVNPEVNLHPNNMSINTLLLSGDQVIHQKSEDTL